MPALLTACIQENPSIRQPDAAAEADGAAGAGGGAGQGGAAGGDPDGCRGALQVEPSPIRFSRDGTVGRRSLPLTVRNQGACPLQLERLQTEGSPRFSVHLRGEDPRRTPQLLEDPDGDGVPGLAVGASFELEVRFENDGPHPQAGTLSLSPVEGVPLEVPLEGDLDGPCLQVDPAALTFDPLPVGSADARELLLSPCGTARVTVTELDLGDSPDLFSLAGAPALPLTLRPEAGPPARARVRFEARQDGTFQGALHIRSDDPLQPEITTRLLAQARPVRCPQAFITPVADALPVGVPIPLDGSRSSSEAPVTASEWIVLQRPPGSVAEPLEALFDQDAPLAGGPPDDPATPTAVFVPDRPGRYRLALRITDALGLESGPCGGDAEAAWLIGEGQNSELWIELSWERPNGQPGGDLDLSLIHPAAQEPPQPPWICNAGDPQPDWGEAGDPTDDPQLLEDITDGSRPEQIRLARPEATASLGGPYRIRVRRLAAAGDGGPVDATVQVFSRGARLTVRTQRLLAGETWRVARLSWPDGTLSPDGP